jgi:hypothetical protein
MLMGNIQGLDIQIPHEIAQYWGWFLAFGIALGVLGVAAVVRAVTATIISMLFFGWLLVLACGIEIAQALLVGHWAGFFQHLVAAILFGVVGVIMITRPLISAEVLRRAFRADELRVLLAGDGRQTHRRGGTPDDRGDGDGRGEPRVAAI